MTEGEFLGFCIDIRIKALEYTSRIGLGVGGDTNVDQVIALKDIKEWKEEGVEIEEMSVHHAICFIKKNEVLMPDIEIQPDGEVAFTWRMLNVGIINMAFNKQGIATWAAYFNGDEKRTFKGRFFVVSQLPQSLRGKYPLVSSTEEFIKNKHREARMEDKKFNNV